MNVMFRSPRSTAPKYERSTSATSASCSCVRPMRFRCTLIRFPSSRRIASSSIGEVRAIMRIISPRAFLSHFKKMAVGRALRAHRNDGAWRL